LLRFLLFQSKTCENRLTVLQNAQSTTNTEELENCQKLKKISDRRIYELDTFKSILSKIEDFDFRFPLSSSTVTTDEEDEIDEVKKKEYLSLR
jgi:hypothetical protein